MKEKILAALSQVDDPDLKKDIVSLGMVQDLNIEGKKVSFRFVLTTPACPLKEVMKNACINAIKLLVDETLEVDITFDSKVTSSKTNEKTPLLGIKNIIAVASGKGGVGKSTVAANLAIALGKLGAKTGLLDADIYGPSVPILMNIKGRQPESKQEGEKISIIPFQQYGIKVMSLGSLINEKQALIWRGPMISSALKQLLMDVDWGELDYLVVDMPPGTGDIYLTLAQQFPLSAAVIVTTPQEVALADTRKSIEMFRIPALNIPILGIVENMSWFTPAEMPDKKYYLFGKNGGKMLSLQYDVPLLAQIPLYRQSGEENVEELPAVMQESSPLHLEFMKVAENVAQQLAILNSQDLILEK